MDSLYETLKNALQQAADCQKMFEDAKEESQRLAAKYQDILTERQALREANRTLNSTIFQLRARVEDMETQLELQLDSMTRPCACKMQSSNSAIHKGEDSLSFTTSRVSNKPSAPISIAALDGKDAEEAEDVAQGSHVLSLRQPEDFPQRESWAEHPEIQEDSPRMIGRNSSMNEFSSTFYNGKSPAFDSRIWGTKYRSRFPDTPSHHSSTSYEIQGRTQHEVKEPAKQQVYQPPHAQLKMANQSGTSDSGGVWRRPGASTSQSGLGRR